MKQRKVWNSEQDRVLKLLIEERGITKWALISQIMQKQFSIHGRNGKQCRQRYHNHLDKNINNEQWTLEQENILFNIQDQYGNKWALISSKLPGRSDNCVKNHFYSKLRKGLRKVNKKINKCLKKQYKDIKTATLYKVIETMQNRNKGNFNIQQQTLELCRKIKNKLRQYDDSSTNFQDQNDQLIYVKAIIQDLVFFDKDIKKIGKKGSVKSSYMEDEPPSPTRLRISGKLSTKSMYDGQDSSYSNSDLFSSSSFDHKSFCSMRSNRSQNKSSKQHLKAQPNLFRSQSIASESQKDSDPSQEQNLCKSANSATRVPKKKTTLKAELSNSLSLPMCHHQLSHAFSGSRSMKLPSPDFTNSIDKVSKRQVQVQIKKEQSQKMKSQSNKSKHNSQAQNQNQIFYTYMMGQQPFEMRLFSPKRLTVEQKIQMNDQNDDLFCGQSMQIESQGLIQNMNNLSINQMPTLSRNRQLRDL